MCVYGLGISQQSGKINEVAKGSDYLLQAIKASNKFFRDIKIKGIEEDGGLEKLNEQTKSKQGISQQLELQGKELEIN